MEPFVLKPNGIPLIVSIPHAGTHLPETVLKNLASDAMRELPLTDWHVHELFDFLPEIGITAIHATWSRFYSDLNRPPDMDALSPGSFKTGIIALETEHGEVVWAKPPSAEQIVEWQQQVHAPYHERLTELLEETRLIYGRAVLIDAHSVPSYENIEHMALDADIYLGDRNGQSCGAWLIDAVQAALEEEGLAVARNGPFAGGYITEHYGKMEQVETLQVEVVQRIYMDESDPASALESPQFARAKAMLKGAFEKVRRAVRDEVF